ncbi:facilitated trehalose transporter Tret1-like [Panulirus ornatus]|uniref:facilitated trehalose transporter Tret1-like n=1 Tax=Panulirus ornatus TaxID=150431 RepID=UPI003A8379B7
MELEVVHQPVPSRCGRRKRGLATTVLVSVSSGLLMSSISGIFAYPSVALPQLTGTNETLQLSIPQASWFATMPLFLCIPGSVVGGLLCERLGPRRTQILFSPLLSLSLVAMHLGSWRFIQEAGAAQVILLITRAIQGTIISLLNPTIAVYPCEVSSARHRGIVGSLIESWASLGLLLCYVMAKYLHWYTAAWLLPLTTIVPSFFGLLIAPESPLWLFRKGREGKAIATLLRLRDSPEEVVREITELKKNSEKNTSCSKLLQIVRRRANAVPMTISVTLLMLKEFSGLSVLTLYIVTIFQLAGVGLDPFSSSIVIGSTRLVFNFFGSALLHRLPRRYLLIRGNFLTAVTTGTIGIFFYLQAREYDLTQVNSLPLISLVIYMLGMSVGVGPVTWLMAAELLPGPVRSLGLGVTVTGYAITSFVVSKTFEDVKALIGLHGLFWCYSVGCVAYMLFVIFIVPETQGRTLKEIENFWAKSGYEKEVPSEDDDV